MLGKAGSRAVKTTPANCNGSTLSHWKTSKSIKRLAWLNRDLIAAFQRKTSVIQVKPDKTKDRLQRRNLETLLGHAGIATGEKLT